MLFESDSVVLVHNVDYYDKENSTITTSLDSFVIDKNTIEVLHAAAKSIGMEIGWDTSYGRNLPVGYTPAWWDTTIDDSKYNQGIEQKTPALAIAYAFCAAVEYKLKGGAEYKKQKKASL